MLRRLMSATTICVVGGLLGGLALGYVLSRQGGWLTPAPWAVYLVALLAAIGAVTWLDERRRLRVAATAGAPALGVPDGPPLDDTDEVMLSSAEPAGENMPLPSGAGRISDELAVSMPAATEEAGPAIRDPGAVEAEC